MSPLPTRMRDRWLNRTECACDSGMVYWHVLMYGDPEARAAAMEAQEAIAAFPGLHSTPLRWLHITTLIVGSTDDVTRSQMSDMVVAARRLLRDLRPIPVTMGKVFYHPEAIVLTIEPTGALQPILDAAESATTSTLGRVDRQGTFDSSWTPHMTISYSTADQPVEPIFAALGRSIDEHRAVIDSLTLVIQWGHERGWNWEPVGTARLSSHLSKGKRG